MKPIIKYISLLIFSGLILPFYIIPAKRPLQKLPPPAEMVPADAPSIDVANGLAFCIDMAMEAFPALKSLNSL